MNFLIIDGLNLIRRVYAGVPGEAGSEAHMQAVEQACVASLGKAIRRQQPSHCVNVMDSTEPSWRHQRFPDYKANRKAMPEPLSTGLSRILEKFEESGVHSVQHVGYEADDVIATIAVRVSTAGGQVTILSTDKSFCQLLRPGVRVYNHFDDRFLDADYVRQRFEVNPGQIPVFQALVGEPSLNVSGVHGIGKRTAAKLIQDYGELDGILAATEQVTGNIGNKLREGSGDARKAYHLLRLRTDLELGLNLKDFRLPH